MIKSGRVTQHMLQRLFSIARADIPHHLTRDELIETLQQPECALCVLARHKSQRYIETLLDTAVMDVAHRDAWRLSKGLCAVHARLAIEMPQSAGSLAILYEDVLRHAIADLTPLATPELSRPAWYVRRRLRQQVQKWLRAWQQRPPCAICHLWQAQENRYLVVLLDAWHDTALTRAFSCSCGLCLPHLARLILVGGTHRHLSAVLAAQQACLQTLYDDLREFVRKQDYRFAHEPYGSEADAWRRAVRLLSGINDSNRLT